jgi:hypothetical protein
MSRKLPIRKPGADVQLSQFTGDARLWSHARELSSYLGPDYLRSLKEKALALFNLVSWKGACFTCEVFF